jgi:hypothetical protein
MSWKQALCQLDTCYDRDVLVDKLGASHREIAMALNGTADSVRPEVKRRVRDEIKRMKGDHTAAHEVGVYALQTLYQLRDAESEEIREEILRRCVPLLEHKVEGLRAPTDGTDVGS